MYNLYKIKTGDSLESIASYFGISPEQIIEVNNLDSNNYLRENMDLIVPNSSKQYFEYYTIRKGDNLYQIAKKYNINPTLLSSLNGLNENDYIYPNQVLLIPKSNYSYYITKEGDTLDIVANTFGISRDTLLNNNDTIYLLEGQLLVKKNK